MNNFTHSEQSLTPKEAGKIACVHPQTLRRYEESGILKSSRTAGGHRRYNKQDIINLAQAVNEPSLHSNSHNAVQEKAMPTSFEPSQIVTSDDTFCEYKEKGSINTQWNKRVSEEFGIDGLVKYLVVVPLVFISAIGTVAQASVNMFSLTLSLGIWLAWCIAMIFFTVKETTLEHVVLEKEKVNPRQKIKHFVWYDSESKTVLFVQTMKQNHHIQYTVFAPNQTSAVQDQLLQSQNLSSKIVVYDDLAKQAWQEYQQKEKESQILEQKINSVL